MSKIEKMISVLGEEGEKEVEQMLIKKLTQKNGAVSLRINEIIKQKLIEEIGEEKSINEVLESLIVYYLRIDKEQREDIFSNNKTINYIEDVVCKE